MLDSFSSRDELWESLKWHRETLARALLTIDTLTDALQAPDSLRAIQEARENVAQLRKRFIVTGADVVRMS